MRAQELYASITQRIIDELEAGVCPWTKPWKDVRQVGGIMPNNGATNRPYSGSNVLLLWHAKLEKGYKTSNWLTYRQAHELGGQVRKGEKSTEILFTKQHTVKDKQTEEEKRISFLRTYNVFNEDQIDGLPERGVEILPSVDPIPAVDAFIKATWANIVIGGNRAFYDTSCDRIHLPDPSQFRTVEHFYATNLHESVHWSGRAHRLDRNLTGRFGTRDYAAEELVAELGAAFLCGHLNIQGELKHAEYIKTWIQLLKEDDRAIITAASLASKAADFLRAFSEKKEEAA